MQITTPPQDVNVELRKALSGAVESAQGCCHVQVVCGGNEHDRALPVVALFEQIAQEEGWQPGGELRSHISRSVYFLLQHCVDSANGNTPAQDIVGALQLIPASANATMPSGYIWHDVNFTERHECIAHVSVLALRKGWRGRKDAFMLFWLIAVAMWQYCVKEGIEELWLETTPRVLATYQRLGFPLTVRGDLREHWGEPCYLTSMTVREVAGALAEKAYRGASTYRSILTRACLQDDLEILTME
jgi:hypothetical protein